MREPPKPSRRADARRRPAAGGGLAGEFAPLLGAKLLPPTPGQFHFTRPRLLDRLSAGLDKRATFVLAGPGYGKTSLLASFIESLRSEAVWYWLDPTDRDPWIFFRYLIQGIKEHAPDFGERSEGTWKDLRTRPFEVEHLADIFISEAEESLGGRIVLVLDEVQHLEGSELLSRALRRLLAYLPGTLHLILVGRSLPDLGARAAAAEGSVGVLEGEELLFTLEETRALLVETFGLTVRPETIEKIHARTRGWVTALQLLRQTARLGPAAPDLPEEVFARTESEIFDYFTDEVYGSESDEVRAFLLGSSPAAFIDPDICAEVLERTDVRRILTLLLKRRLFISPLESRGEYYAYDPLFLGFLRRRLASEEGLARRRELDLRYGRAYARRGAFTQALSHWIAAEEVESVTELLRRQGKALLRSGTTDAVLQAARFLTGRGVRSAVVEDLLGEACRVAGDYAAAVGHFERALGEEDATRLAAEDSSRASTLQGLAYSLLKTGDLRRAEDVATRALAEAGGIERRGAMPDDLSLVARILNTLSIIRYRENRLQEALEGWQEALTRARQADDKHLILMIAHNLGLPHAVRGDFRRASECFQILTGPDNPRLGPEEGAAYLNLARIATLRGAYADAGALLGDAKEIARKWRLQALEADVLEAEGNLLRERGDLDAAEERYGRARAHFTELGRLDLATNLAEEEAILASRRRKHPDAERQALALVDRARAAGETESLASALLALGEIRMRAGADAAAVDPLVEASALFRSLDRAYQRCMAHLWLAMALHRAKQPGMAESEALESLRLAAQLDYGAAVARVSALDAGFLRVVAALPAAAGLLPVPPAEMARAARPARAVPLPGSDLTVRLLGQIEVFRDADRTIPASAWKIKRALEVFCYVACSRNRRAAKDKIVDALWGAARPSVIEKNFHPTISFLRGALNYGHNVPKHFIMYEGGAYLLNPAYDYDLDTERFEERIRAAKVKASRRDPKGALADYTDALGLYGGSFMEEDYAEWTEGPRSHFQELLLGALGEAGRLNLEVGDPETAVSLLKRLVELAPLDEDASVQLMAALGSRAGRGGIEKEFARLTRALTEELSVEPLPETQRAYEQALESCLSPTALPGGRRRSREGPTQRRVPRARGDN